MSIKTELIRESGYLVRKVRSHPADLPSHFLRSYHLFCAQQRLASLSDLNSRKAGYLAHFGVHLTGDNSGDVVLYDAVQRIIASHIGEARFRSLPLRRPVSSDLIETLNRNARAIVLGGGGLFFPTDCLKSHSGWQWNIPIRTLEAIRIPLIVYAVGVNNFREQTGFDQRAIEHLTTTCNKADFIGLRNHGSLHKLTQIAPTIQPDKLHWQPCPTTVLSYFTELKPRETQDFRTIAVNTAVDKIELRFKGKTDQVMHGIAEACLRLSLSGNRIVVATHAEQDDYILPYLKQKRVNFQVRRLERCLPQEIIDFYSKVDLTLGMRGHAQMIPFGCGNAIVSIKSHDKLGFFLEDIGHTEWGLEALQPDLSERLVELSESILQDLPAVQREIVCAREKLWRVCQENLKSIRNLIGEL